MNLFPLNVKLISTERIIEGGRSLGSFNNFNLALHVNDKKEDVISNRSLLKNYYDLPSDPVWLNQTHSSICLDATGLKSIKEADASFTCESGIVCGILTADCLPVFVSKKDGSMVGIAHAGWRGLASGVIEKLIDKFDCRGEDIVVHLGPAISMYSFEIGEEVKEIYLNKNARFDRCFSYQNNKLFLDLYDAARVVLESYKINSISGGERCTYKEMDYFFSYRREGENTGRMAHLIWMI